MDMLEFSDCKTCKSYQICKYADEYTNSTTELSSIDVCSVGNIEYKCKHYQLNADTRVDVGYPM